MATSGFIVHVPQAEDCVSALRARFDPSAALGVPAHITVLFPFMDPDLVSSAVLQRAAAAIRTVPRFSFCLASIGRFPEVAFLAPEPQAPFVALTRALAAAFPDYPPFGGQHPSIVPHLTIANGGAEAAEHAAAGAGNWLATNGPIHALCDTVSLLDDSAGTWKQMHAFELGAPAIRPSPIRHKSAGR